MKRSMSVIVLSVLLVVVGVSGTASSEQARPFKAHWLTTFGPPGPGITGCDGDAATGIFVIEGGGVATHLGRNTLVADSEVGFGTQCGHTVLTAADGDELEFDFEGGVSPPDPDLNIAFSGTWTITGGTGRFSDAKGGGTYEGTANLLTAEGQFSQVGTISY